jgi:predicted AAA+ superfamily ATPase
MIYIHRGEELALYYLRKAAGSEVDIVIETQDQLVPIESKRSETPRLEMAKEIISFQKIFKTRLARGMSFIQVQ